MKGLIETVMTEGTVIPYGDFNEQDLKSMFDNYEPKIVYDGPVFLTSSKFNIEIKHTLKRWGRWENGCPTSMDKFIRKLEAKEARAYRLKHKNKHKYGRSTKTKRHSRKRKA